MNGGKISFEQGGIYLAQFNPNKGHEIGKLRPIILLSSQKILNNTPTLLFVCPLSSQSFGVNKFLHFYITKRDELNKDSFALIEHTRAISVERVIPQYLGHLTPVEFNNIRKLINILIN